MPTKTRSKLIISGWQAISLSRIRRMHSWKQRRCWILIGGWSNFRRRDLRTFGRSAHAIWDDQFRSGDGRMRPSRTNSIEGRSTHSTKEGFSRVETVETGRKAKSRARTTQGHAGPRKVERAMRIENTAFE